LSDAFRKGFAEKASWMLRQSGMRGRMESPESSMRSLEEIDRIYQRVIKKLDLKAE